MFVIPTPKSQTSLAKKYVMRVVLEEKKGTVRTQTSQSERRGGASRVRSEYQRQEGVDGKFEIVHHC